MMLGYDLHQIVDEPTSAPSTTNTSLESPGADLSGYAMHMTLYTYHQCYSSFSSLNEMASDKAQLCRCA